MVFEVDYLDTLIWDFRIFSYSNTGAEIHQEACFNKAFKQLLKGELGAN